MSEPLLLDRRPERDFGFYRRAGRGKWAAVEPPVLEAPVVDSHAHLHATAYPAWELARCAVHGVDALCEVYDPAVDDVDLERDLSSWRAEAQGALERAATEPSDTLALPPQMQVEDAVVPELRVIAGIHPHHADLYDDVLEARLVECLRLPGAVALGEIGLDYYRNHSPHEDQQRVFRRQIELAKQLDLPIALHLRSAEDKNAPNAHEDALRILCEEGFPAAGTLLHCCTLGPAELQPWLEEGCYVAYGGALTYKSAGAAREAALFVPPDRLLLETDAPYMAPEPCKGTKCTPAHIVLTAAFLADLRGAAEGEGRGKFLAMLASNARRLFGSSVV